MGVVLISSSPSYSQDGSVCDMDSFIDELDLHLDIMLVIPVTPPPRDLASSASRALERAPDNGSISLGVSPDGSDPT